MENWSGLASAILAGPEVTFGNFVSSGKIYSKNRSAENVRFEVVLMLSAFSAGPEVTFGNFASSGEIYSKNRSAGNDWFEVILMQTLLFVFSS